MQIELIVANKILTNREQNGANKEQEIEPADDASNMLSDEITPIDRLMRKSIVGVTSGDRLEPILF